MRPRPKSDNDDNNQIRSVILSILGTILIVTGVLTLSFGSCFIEYLINKIMVFTPNSTIYKQWQTNSIPIPIDIYLFNWTNPDQIHNISVKPNFEELGPYRFLQTTRKVNVTWNYLNDTVTYRQNTLYQFDEKSTKGSLSDRITTLNAMAVMSSYKTRLWGYSARKGLSLTLSSISANVHVTKTVGELLFDGYDDTLLSMVNNFQFLADTKTPAMDKFAWFRIKNNSAWHDGVINMGVGHGNFGEIKNWNYKNSTDFYEGECGKVRGSAGQFYQRPFAKDKAGFFSTDLCAYLQLDYEQEIHINHVLGHKYVLGDSALDNGTKVQKNSCYCTGECIPSGVRNISSCRFGAPSFSSLPHFYKADPYYVNLLDGMKPQKELHDSYIVFEPTTGIPLSVNIALQINLLLQPIKQIALYEKVPKVFFPVLWFKNSFTIPEDVAAKLNIFLKLPLIIIICALLAIVIGIFLTVCFLNELCSFERRKKLSYNNRKNCETVPLRSTKQT